LIANYTLFLRIWNKLFYWIAC